MKNPLTPAGIEPATYRFVAQHLNHCATAVPKKKKTNPKHAGTQMKRLFTVRTFIIHFKEHVCM